MNIFKNWYYLAANMTPPERALEGAIAALGERYRSQWLFPRHYHIADFVLLDRKLVIEVDGPSHESPKQRYKDAQHTIALEQDGWKVVRCSNEEALTSPGATLLDCLTHRITARPGLGELRKVLGQLAPLLSQKRAKPRTPAKAPAPKRGARARRKPESGKTAE